MDRIRKRILSALHASQTDLEGEAYLGRVGITSEEDIEIVCSYINSPNATSLRSLILSENKGIGDIGGEKICIALTISQYCKLQYLDLQFTGIGGMNSMRALREYLISPSSSYLKTLYLTGNKNIGDKGVRLLSSALSRNSSLSSLYLDVCDIGDQGALLLQYLLSNYNSSLSTLYLDYRNQIDKNFQIRISEIENKYLNYNQIFERTNPQSLSPNSSQRNSKRFNWGDGEHLTTEDQQKLLQYLGPIFEPLPAWQSISNDHNLIRSMILSLNTNRYLNVRRVTSIKVINWRILLICSIINSFT